MFIRASSISGRLSRIALLSFLFCACAKQFNGSYNNVKLSIDSIVPAMGNSGTAVRIYGKGFADPAGNNKVFFNGVAATVDSNAALGVLLAYAPAAGTTGNVQISDASDSATGPVFTYAAPAPVITNIVYNGLFAITGQHFDPQLSVVKIGGQVVNGFNFSDLGNGQGQLVKQPFTPASNLNNPAPVIVSVNSVGSNVYTFLFAPVVNSISPDTVSANEIIVLQGILFGNQSLPGSVKAFYFDAGGNKTYMAPDPVIVSWNTNTIQVTMQDYGSYPVGSGGIPMYLEVNVGSRSGSAQARFHIT